jgi:uncharacterized protein (TIGR02117 family)
MPGLRKLLRALRLVAVALLAFLLLYGLAVALLPRFAVNSAYAPPASGLTIYVESNGVHTDFVVPVRSSVVDWTAVVHPADFARVDDSFSYVAFGWGDRGFYLETPHWSDLKLGTAFKATFFLSSSAMHVTYVRFEPQRDAECRRLVVSDEQYRALVDFLLASFARDERGAVRRIDHPGYTPCDAFFEAVGTYSFVDTCNEWTGAGLRAMGVKTGCWTPFAGDVLRYLPD